MVKLRSKRNKGVLDRLSEQVFEKEDGKKLIDSSHIVAA